jgi:hypothetical protein
MRRIHGSRAGDITLPGLLCSGARLGKCHSTVSVQSRRRSSTPAAAEGQTVVVSGHGDKSRGAVRFFQSGRLLFEEPYRGGQAHGIARQWSQDGKLIGTYAMDRGAGVDIWRQELDGEPPYVSEIRYFKNGRRHGFEWWLTTRKPFGASAISGMASFTASSEPRMRPPRFAVASRVTGSMGSASRSGAIYEPAPTIHRYRPLV